MRKARHIARRAMFAKISQRPSETARAKKRYASCAEKIPACKTFSLLQEASVGLSESVPENERNALRVAAERELSTAHVGGGEADQSSLT